MARKSRATGGNLPQTQQKWNAALYIRLSREDGDKEESDSVQNQRELLQSFAASEPDMGIQEIFIDDGYTGTSFERPGFERMMEKIRRKEINCVIVKDLSRFGRNYIAVGNYLEQIFPFLNVRFISINDMLDSYQNPQSMNNLLIPVKNIINDEYCRDISNKVRSTLDRKRRDGKFIGSFACYGYRKDPADKNRLLTDTEAAETVQQIFQWFLEGVSVLGITRRLNERSIPSPSAYKQSLGMNYRPANGGGGQWNDRTVRRILHNQMYIGNLVQGVSRVRSYKMQKPVEIPQEDWIVVENTHQPIIAPAVFEQVQDLLRRDTRTPPKKQQVSLFAGFLECFDCGRAMEKKTNRQPYGTYVYYHCSTYTKRDREACTKHTIREMELEQAVLASIQKQIALVVSMDELIDKINRSPTARRQSGRLERSIAEQERTLEKLRGFRRSLYEDWKNGDITREEYRDMKAAYEGQIAEAEGALTLLRQQRQAAKGIDRENGFLQSFLRHRNVTALTRELLVALVDKILIHEDKAITIRFKFADAFQEARDFIRDNPTAGGDLEKTA